MRVCILGGGIAGSLLAWRLAAEPGLQRLTLVPGPSGRLDATGASGGAVRCYEPDEPARRLATASVVELLAQPTLRSWSGYVQTGSTYARASSAGLEQAIADVDAAVPGSARLVAGADLPGWTGLPAGSVAVCERVAGYLDPAGWRRRLLAELATYPVVTVLPGTGALAPSLAAHDAVVLATGAWTPGLLAAAGLPADEWRTKAVQYAVYDAPGWRGTAFVDESTGLYGRPSGPGGLLLGLPTESWQVPAGAIGFSTELQQQAQQLAADRFPALRLGACRFVAGAADCYTRPPVLALRPVTGTDSRLFTFAGGSGGAAKSALAASRQAADTLVEHLHPRLAAHPFSGRRVP